MQTPTTQPSEILTEPTNKRIQTFDILRGMALMGILIVHMTSGIDWLFASPEQRASLPFPELNNAIDSVIEFLFIGKSRALFAFMFGVSFFLQFKSSKPKQKLFHVTFLWRLCILMILGLLHAHLLFGADILRYYAVGGLLLIFAHKWSDKTLLMIGFLLTVAIPTIYSLFIDLNNINPFANIDGKAIDDGLMSTSYFDNLQANHIDALIRYYPTLIINFAVPVTGIFLFGIWMARRNYIQESYKYVKTLKRFFFWGLGLGFLIQLGLNLISFDFKDFSMSTKIAWILCSNVLSNSGVLLVSLGYVSGLTLLCLNPRFQKILAFLAPAGRMTLTNYVMQSVFVWVIFYGSGLGLYMKIGPAITLFIALALCAFQLVASYYWLKYFKTGPLEWLWRYATSGKKPEFIIVKEQTIINQVN